MELEVLKTDGLAAGNKVELPKAIFEIEANDHLIYQAIRCQQKKQRQGTAATKTRAMVRGGGKKPWKQKGRGTARAGSSRSPLWSGGGRVFGPHPRDLHMKLNKKMKKQARASAYSLKAKQQEVMLCEEIKLEKPKTKELFQVMKNLNISDKKVLLLTNNYSTDVIRAGNNIPNLIVRQAVDASTYDILNCNVLLIEKDALDKITEVCNS